MQDAMVGDEGAYILLVDDEPAHGEAVRRAFYEAHVNRPIRLAGTLREYRELVAARTPQIAILDLVLPDGRATEILTAPPESGSFPIVIMTSHGDERICVEALKGGALDYVVKSPEAFRSMPHTVERTLREWGVLQSSKKAEAALRASDGQLRTILRTSLEGYCLLDEQGSLLDVNDEYCRMSGYGRGELLAMSIRDLDASENDGEIAEIIQKLMATGWARMDRALRRKDGRVINVEVSTTHMPREGRICAFLRDVTEQRRQAAERESTLALMRILNTPGETRELIRAITEFLRQRSGCEAAGIRLCEGNHTLYYETSGFPAEVVQAEDSGCTEEETFWTNSTSKVAASATEAGRNSRTWNRCHGEEYESVALIPLKCVGRIIGWMEFCDRRMDRFTPELIAALERAGASVAAALDQRLSQTALRASEEKFRGMAEQIVDLVYLTDSEGRFTYVSPSVSQSLGWSPQDATGKFFGEFLPPEELPKAMAAFEAAVVSGDVIRNLSLTVKRKDGSAFVGELSGSAFHAEGAAAGTLGIVRDVTEKNRAEEALRESEQRYRSLVATSLDAVLLTTPNGEILSANPAACRMFGCPEEEMIRLGRQPFVDASDPRLRAALAERSETGRFSGELTFVRRDGTKFPGEVSSAVFSVRQGELRNSLVIRDISERKRAEQELRASEERYRSVVESLGEGVVTVAPQGRLLVANAAAEAILGVDRGELPDRNLAEFLPPSELSKFEQVTLDLRAGKKSTLELEIARPDETRRTVLVTATPRLGGQRYEGATAVFRDITDSRQMEERIHLLANALRCAGDCISITDVTGNIQYVNDAFLETFGYAREDLLDRPVDMVQSRNAPDLMKDILPATLRGGWQGEVWNRSREGREFPVMLKTAAVRDDNGRVIGLVGSSRDLTDQRLAEQALRQSEERYRAIVETAEEGIVTLDHEGRIALVNRKLAGLLGYATEELLGTSFLRLVEEDWRDSLATQPEGHGRGMRTQFECRLRRKDGSDLSAIVCTSPLYDSSGGLEGKLAMITDVTARARVEEEVRRMNTELRGLSGELLHTQDRERRRIARDLHDSTAQLLAALDMNLATLEKDGVLSVRAKRLATDSHALAKQCSREIRAVSYLLHPPLLDELGVVPAVTDYAAGFTRRSGIVVALEVAPDLGRLGTDVELALFRIIQECLANVHRHSGAQRATIRLARGEREVRLDISDDGRGFPPHILSGGVSRAGMGVGVLGMRERASQLGGSLLIESSDRGARVLVTLPLGGSDETD